MSSVYHKLQIEVFPIRCPKVWNILTYKVTVRNTQKKGQLPDDVNYFNHQNPSVCYCRLNLGGIDNLNKNAKTKLILVGVVKCRHRHQGQRI